MKNRITSALLLSLVAGSLLASPVMAQTDQTDPGHPRVNEVDSRLQNQQNRVDAGVKDGQLNAKEAARDTKRDERVSQQLSKDEAKHGGHITKREQRKLNKELNKNSKRIHRQRATGQKHIENSSKPAQ